MFFQNRNIFNILFEAIPEGVIIVDKNRTIIVANSSVENMFGYKKGELTNKNLNILIPEKHHLNHNKNFSNFIQKNNISKINHNSNLIGVKQNKDEFPVEIGLNPFKINDDYYIIALIIDITSRKENEQKIEELNLDLEKKISQRTTELNKTIKKLKHLNLDYLKEIEKRKVAEKQLKKSLKKEQELNNLKTKFLSLVSHEFKTPLSGILTSTILLDKYQLTEQQEKRNRHIKTITSKVHYLNNILNDFLSIEQLESSKVNYKFKKFNLSKIVNEVVYNANTLLKNGQHITIPNNVEEYILFQDEKIVELILTNLLYNAIKYSPENSKIKLTISSTKNHLQLSIIDEGIGIPKNDQKYIFNRYFRAENVLNTQGTGIGLNIVQTHIQNLGGSIQFKSVENFGSTFTVKLPINNKL
ncbi:ATP-binding protein [uncultured Lutibacter sp.]|uniref:PAS domain-containing sensor histidine kinase n=1 Tax=uncultured Lutibacter sp. TaxID=437739 RepID=UPI00263657A8|nr:ATP-binding protein [uncultured Lutibacter sp.]